MGHLERQIEPPFLGCAFWGLDVVNETRLVLKGLAYFEAFSMAWRYINKLDHQPLKLMIVLKAISFCQKVGNVASGLPAFSLAMSFGLIIKVKKLPFTIKIAYIYQSQDKLIS